MQAILNLIAPDTRPDDSRDKWVALVSVVGLCALLVSDLISLL